MPDLGDYSAHVLACYAITIGCLAVLVALTLRRGSRVRAELDAIEQRDV